MAKRLGGFGKFDSLMRKLIQINPDELRPLTREEAEREVGAAQPGKSMPRNQVDAIMRFVRKHSKKRKRRK